MPPRRPRRSVVKEESTETSTPSRRASRHAKPDPVELGDEVAEDEAEAEAEEAEEIIPEAGPSRRGRGRGKAAKLKAEQTPEGDAENEEDVTGTPRRRSRKSVSYREVPVEDIAEDDVPEEEEDEDVAPEAEEEVQAEGSDEGDSPEKTKKRSNRAILEKVGSGRGGFSVKGAAAAAARARWAKVRQQKLERGEESEDEKPKRRGTSGPSTATRNKKASDETPEKGSTVLIKGQEYIMGEDELILPDHEKGDAKIDREGRLQGGREFKFYTFTSDQRSNPNRVYTLTIDVARACGYSDSLAFLRRVPQIMKLACLPVERDMLIEKGRVTGNLKHRMVTMVAVRNIYKLLGAKVIKDGKWVTDDYDEAEALVKCQEGGHTPGSLIQEEESMQNAQSNANAYGRTGDAASRAANLVPFYTVGGLTTQFGGNGVNPLFDAGWGNKRAKLKTMGVTEEDWMFRTAEESRRVDGILRGYRAERLVPLEEMDRKVWVYATENLAEGRVDAEPEVDAEGSKAATALAVKNDEEALTPLPIEEGEEKDLEAGSRRSMNGEGTIIVETEEDEKRNASKWNWGLGSWRAGVVKAVYEPHTHTPHVPLITQPGSALRERLSQSPLLASYSDSKHTNFVQSSVSGRAARGLASVEYALETRAEAPRTDDDVWYMGDLVSNAQKRLRAVQEAEAWEREAKKKQKQAKQAV